MRCGKTTLMPTNFSSHSFRHTMRSLPQSYAVTRMIEEVGGTNFGRQAQAAGVTSAAFVNQSSVTRRARGQDCPKDKADQLERIILISCAGMRQELSNYIENEVTPELRFRIETHLRFCPECKAVFDGMRNVLALIRARDVIELPAGFSLRLYRRLAEVCPPGQRF